MVTLIYMFNFRQYSIHCEHKLLQRQLWAVVQQWLAAGTALFKAKKIGGLGKASTTHTLSVHYSFPHFLYILVSIQYKWFLQIIRKTIKMNAFSISFENNFIWKRNPLCLSLVKRWVKNGLNYKYKFSTLSWCLITSSASRPLAFYEKPHQIHYKSALKFLRCRIKKSKKMYDHSSTPLKHVNYCK